MDFQCAADVFFILEVVLKTKDQDWKDIKCYVSNTHGFIPMLESNLICCGDFLNRSLQDAMKTFMSINNILSPQ